MAVNYYGREVLLNDACPADASAYESTVAWVFFALASRPVDS